jgi:small-conductance mechanosensitive channel
VRFHTFGEYSIQFTVVLRAEDTTERFLIIHEFVKQLHDRYRSEGIEVPYPVRTIKLETEGKALDLDRARSIAGGRRR